MGCSKGALLLGQKIHDGRPGQVRCVLATVSHQIVELNRVIGNLIDALVAQRWLWLSLVPEILVKNLTQCICEKNYGVTNGGIFGPLCYCLDTAHFVSYSFSDPSLFFLGIVVGH